jgi:hypothetical protein
VRRTRSSGRPTSRFGFRRSHERQRAAPRGRLLRSGATGSLSLAYGARLPPRARSPATCAGRRAGGSARRARSAHPRQARTARSSSLSGRAGGCRSRQTGVRRVRNARPRTDRLAIVAGGIDERANSVMADQSGHLALPNKATSTRITTATSEHPAAVAPQPPPPAPPRAAGTQRWCLFHRSPKLYQLTSVKAHAA